MNSKEESKVYTTTQSKGLFAWAKNWANGQSLWQYPFGVSCCTTEYTNAQDHYEFSAAPAFLSDLLVIAGPVNVKSLPDLLEVYNEMRSPKWVIAMGGCAINGGPFFDSYNIINNIEDYLPVDVSIPGCPPSSEALISGIETIKLKIKEGRNS